MDFVYAALRWLKDNSAVLTAAVTAVATIVIAWASVLSSRLFRLQKKIEKANRMPVLTFVEEEGAADRREVYIKNAGYGPALNIVRKVINPGALLGIKPRLYTEPQEVTIGALAPKEKAYAYICTCPGDYSALILNDALLHVVIECDDIVDGHYEFTYCKRAHSKPVPIFRRKIPPSQTRQI
jgi:hypothetical protein